MHALRILAILLGLAFPSVIFAEDKNPFHAHIALFVQDGQKVPDGYEFEDSAKQPHPILPEPPPRPGQSLGSFTHWIFAALLTLFFPSMVERFHPGTVFAFFCFMMVFQLIWVKLAVPETKGRSLEEIEHELGLAQGR